MNHGFGCGLLSTDRICDEHLFKPWSQKFLSFLGPWCSVRRRKEYSCSPMLQYSTEYQIQNYDYGYNNLTSLPYWSPTIFDRNSWNLPYTLIQTDVNYWGHCRSELRTSIVVANSWVRIPLWSTVVPVSQQQLTSFTTSRLKRRLTV